MADLATIRYGPDLRTLEDVTQQVLARLLTRLPAALWDTDPASPTVQRDLYQALAQQIALWLENRTIARSMTLLLEAEGGDLDTLLHDYGLRRYLRRPDAYARQIGEQMLYTPKGTLLAVSQLADLLLTDLPHRTLRTGRNHVHVLVADTHTISTPLAYWGLVSQEGLWYALTVIHGVPIVTPDPPPGLNQTPSDHTLHWLTVVDELATPWYVSIAEDTLVVSRTPPAWGLGTSTAFTTVDEVGQTWGLQVDSSREALQTVLLLLTPAGGTHLPVLNAGHTFETLRLVDSTGVSWWLTVFGDTPAFLATQQAGTTDVTPPGGPYRWLRLYDLPGALWYLSPMTDGVALLDTVTPGGRGTAVPQSLGNDQGVQWQYGVGGSASFTLNDAPHVTLGGLATAVCLADRTGHRWFWRMNALTQALEWADVLWPDAIEQSPWGDLGWLRVVAADGVPRYLYPDTDGTPLVALAPPVYAWWGWTTPLSFWDSLDIEWQLQVAMGGALVPTPVQPVDIRQAPNPLALRDAVDAIAHVQAAGSVVTVLIT